MKKWIACFLAFCILTAVCAAAAAEDEYVYGGFYPTITKTFSQGQPDEYTFWIRDDSKLALLSILMAQDMLREEYPAYNHIFPIDSLSCVMFNTGKRDADLITVVYAGSDGYLSLQYDMEMEMIWYYIFYQDPDFDSLPAFAKENFGDFFNTMVLNYLNFDFYDPTPAFATAAQSWSDYLDHHPELNNTGNIGY